MQIRGLARVNSRLSLLENTSLWPGARISPQILGIEWTFPSGPTHLARDRSDCMEVKSIGTPLVQAPRKVQIRPLAIPVPKRRIVKQQEKARNSDCRQRGVGSRFETCCAK